MLFWIWVLLLGGGVFFSLRVVIPFIVIYRALSGMTFLCSKVEKQPKEAVPDDILSRFVDTSNSLRTLGFQLIDYYLVASIEGQPPEWAMHWQNSAATIHATVMPVTSDLSALMPLYVSFSSVLTDNRQLISINRKADGIFPPVPQKVEAHYDGMPIDELLKVHQHRLEPFLTAGLVQPATPAEYVSSCKAISLQTAVLLQRQGEAIWVRPNETYRFSRLRAIKSSYNFLRSNKRTNTSADSTSPSQQESNLKEGDITAQVAAFQQAQQKKSGLSLKTRRGLVLASLALFIAVYAASLNIRTVLIFVMVLLLHEGGHVFAMKLFGYRDVAMLFIPFLGALATAKKDDATLTEKVWISLAGPLPGLCLAVLLSAILQLGWISPAGTAAIWLAEAIPILLFLNLFNLLPMYPLDGGQVADLLLFSRRPYFGTVFKVVGVSVLSLLSIFIGQPLLLVFAGLIGATLPASFRIAKFNRQLQKDLDLHSDNLSDTELSNTPLHAIFRQLQHPGYAKLSAAQKMTVAKGALDSYQSLRSPRKNWLGLLATYIMSLLLSLFGSVFSMGALALVESETMLSEEPPTEPIEAAAFAHQCVDVEALPEATALQKVPDDELMSDRQVTLVGKFTTPEQAQSVWQSVFPKLNESDSAQVFGSLILVSTFSDRTQNTITSEFQSHKATVLTEDKFSGNSLILRLTANASTSQQADAVANELSQFFRLSLQFPQLSAPWENTAGAQFNKATSQAATEQEKITRQSNARSTYATLLSFEEDAYMQREIPAFLSWRMTAAALTGNQTWIVSQGIKWEAENAEYIKDSIQDLMEAGDEQVDLEVIDLFLERLALKDEQSQINYQALTNAQLLDIDYTQQTEPIENAIAEIDTRLAEAMGVAANYTQADSGFNDLYGFYGEVKQHDKTIQLELFASSRLQESLPAITTYLCDRSLSSIHYNVTNDSEIWEE